MTLMEMGSRRIYSETKGYEKCLLSQRSVYSDPFASLVLRSSISSRVIKVLLVQIHSDTLEAKVSIFWVQRTLLQVSSPVSLFLRLVPILCRIRFGGKFHVARLVGGRSWDLQYTGGIPAPLVNRPFKSVWWIKISCILRGSCFHIMSTKSYLALTHWPQFTRA